MQEDQDTKVDRSRLTLLLGLTSTAAAAGCLGGPPTSQRRDPYSTFDKRNTDAMDDEDRPGGEGGEGGGGGSH